MSEWSHHRRIGSAATAPRLRALAYALLSLLFMASAALAEKRVALVIGNAQYKNASLVLTNPKNDADDVAAVLRDLGFEVIHAVDATKRDFDLALAKFARLATNADAALFFYAGHALQFQGRNYLMPIDAELEDDVSLRFQMESIEDVRAALDRATGVKIMILDACRNNPMADRLQRKLFGESRALNQTRGLARIDRAQGVVVSYATAADQVAMDGSGRNSPYTTALLKRLREPGLEIEMMFRRIAADVNAQTNGQQRPETYVSLISEYYLNQKDRAIWDGIKTVQNPDTLRDFIELYPTSVYAAEARTRISALEQAVRQQQAVRENAARAQEAQRQQLAALERDRQEREAAQKRAEEEQRAKAEAERQARQQEQERQRVAALERERVAALERERQERDAAQKRADEEQRLKAEAARKLQEQEQERQRVAALERERTAALERERQEREAAQLRETAEQRLKAESERKAREQEQERQRVAALERERVATLERERQERTAAQKRAEDEQRAKAEAARKAQEDERLRVAALERERKEREAAQREAAQRREAEERAKAAAAEQQRKQLAAVPPPAAQPAAPAADACKRDEERLARLRAAPERDEVIRFERELGCDRLRAQVARLRESVAFGEITAAAQPAVQPAARPPAPVQPAETRAAPPPAQPQQQVAARDQPNLRVQSTTPEQACKQDEERLAKLRASRSLEDIAKFVRELSCERLRPQVLRLRESVEAR